MSTSRTIDEGIHRREMLRRAGCGFGMLAAAELLGATPRAIAADRSTKPMVPAALQFPLRARSCIFLYMPGGPSQIDLFDPKPMVTKYARQAAADRAAEADAFQNDRPVRLALEI